VEYNKISENAKTTDDAIMARDAAALIRDHAPNVLFVHFSNSDVVAHDKGWGTPEHLHAIELADAALGMVLDALHDRGLDGDTLLILTADHGGSGTQHGKGDARSHFIPWICVGPGVRANYDLTRNRDHTIHTEDTFATACYFLGLPRGKVAGRPVLDVLSKRDLTTTVPAD
jgi:phosphopentomutase